MNQQLRSFATALASIGIAGRCPTFREWNEAAPVEQRAIVSRWVQILGGSFDPEIGGQTYEAYSEDQKRAWNCALLVYWCGEKIRNEEGYAPRDGQDGEYNPSGAYASHEWGN